MTIPNYICELLYRYDCVIIPNFGALLTSRISAELSTEKNIFYPPQKRLSFNQQIVNNDGLLASHISVSEKISYENAVAKVEIFVKEIQNELIEKSRLSLNEIGLFTLNSEEKLEFEPLHTTNYLTEAFGLSTFSTTDVLRESLKEENEDIVVLEESSQLVAPAGKSNRNRYLQIAAGFALIFGLGTYMSQIYIGNIQDQNNFEYAKGVDMAEEEIQSASFVLDILSPLPSISVTTNKKKEDKINYFHVVAGAFREFENVEKKISQLKKKGFEAAYIGENRYGLHQVAYTSFATRNEAVNALNIIKKTENPSAWLLISK